MSLELWNKLKQPPAEALKKITGGRLNGKSDISPQWRYKAMTETFGICGIGWKYTIDKLWTEPGANNEVFAFASVTVYVKQGDQWSDGIPGNGGNILIEKEKAGLHNNDEGYKMAITDAMGTAMKMLGVAADIYLGNWDGNHYRNPEPPENNGASNGNAPAAPSTKFSWAKASPEQRKLFVFQQLIEARNMPDPQQAHNKIRDILDRIQKTDLSETIKNDIVAEASRLDEEINEECRQNSA